MKGLAQQKCNFVKSVSLMKGISSFYGVINRADSFFDYKIFDKREALITLPLTCDFHLELYKDTIFFDTYFNELQFYYKSIHTH